VGVLVSLEPLLFDTHETSDLDRFHLARLDEFADEARSAPQPLGCLLIGEELSALGAGEIRSVFWHVAMMA
jgi:hypothetical protein